MSSLTVHLDRDEPGGLQAPQTFTVRQPFDVVFENHGRGTRVHLHLDDSLARVARLAEENQFVPGDSAEPVRVEFDSIDEPVTGSLTMSTEYGAKRATVEITVTPYLDDEEPTNEIDVDERLAKPTQKRGESESLLPPVSKSIFVGLSLASLLAAIVVVIIVESPIVILGAVLVALSVIGTLGVALE